MYIGIKPNIDERDIKAVSERLYELLGPAIADRSGWGLLRPGLLNRDLVKDVCKNWRAKVKIHEIYVYPQIQGNWIFFDYLFSKSTTINPLIKCLSSLGIAKYGEIKIPNTYLIVAGLNPESGILIFLYKGEIKTELNNLAFIIAHALDSVNTLRKVEINRKLLIETAYNLLNTGRWKWRGWVTREGRSIPEVALKVKWNKYQRLLKNGNWKTVQLESEYAKIKLYMGERKKYIDIEIRRKYLKPGPKRNLRPIFDDLASSIKPFKINKIKYSKDDRGGILRSYTERRGIVASKK